VTLPILPMLAETLRAGSCGDLTSIVGANGHPLGKRSFGNQFRKACRAANVKRSAHRLRKVAATRAANAGATIAELESVFGWLAAAWRRSTRAPPIGDSLLGERRISSRAMSELLFPHLWGVGSRPRKIANKN
jgi:hypothetical protein